jgi:2-haloacid dehalogenase
MTPKAVVFDIGNVLIEWQPERFYDALMGPERRKAFFAETDVEGMNLLVDQGHPFRETIYDWAEKHPAWHDEIRMWHDRWIEMASPVIPGSVHLMDVLQAKGVPVFSLTNFGVESYDFAATHYPLLRKFDRDFISGHLRMTKPDPAIYQALEDGSGLSGPELIFADDRADNIADAKARGWQTHHFKGPEGWALALVTAGVLTSEEATLP